MTLSTQHSQVIDDIKFSIIEDFTNKICIVIDAHAQPLHLSKNAKSFTGFTRDEILHRIHISPESTESLFFHPNDVALATQSRLSSLKKPSELIEFKAKFLHKTQKFIDVSVELISMPNPRTPAQLITIALLENLSPEAQLNKKLTTLQAKYNDVHDNVPGMLYQLKIDPAGNWSWPFLSNGAMELLGFTSEQIIANPKLPNEVVHPDDLVELMEKVEQSRTSMTKFSWIGRIKPHNSKRIKWVHAQSTPTREPDHSIIWHGSYTDVTPVKDLEQKLQQQNELLQMISKRAPGMIYQFSIDTDGNWQWLYVSEGSKTMLNVAPEELYQDPYIMMARIALADQELLIKKISESKQNLSPFSWVGQIQPHPTDAHQKTTWVHAQSTPHRDEDNLTIWNGIFTDITLLKDFEQLQNKFTTSEQEKAEAIKENMSKTKFLAELSHELRTPLNAINGFSELFLEGMAGSITKKQRHYLSQIHSSGLHLLKLINQILDMSKIIANKQIYTPQKTELNQFFSEFNQAIEPLVKKKNIALKIELLAQPQEVQLDQLKLKQVLYNVVHNAIKYSPKESTIEVKSKLENSVLTIAVQDNGYGIAPELKTALFESFMSSTPFTSLKEHPHAHLLNHLDEEAPISTGLGLYLTKLLVENMNGTIEIMSEGRNHGTTVIITLNDIALS